MVRKAVKRRPGRPAGSTGQSGRAALLKAARELLSHDSATQRLTLTEVAKRAGVNPAMVNYHFGSKSELISALIEEAMQESLRRIGSITPTDDPPPVKLRRRVRSVVDLYKEHPYISRLLKEQVFYSDGEARKAYLEGFFPGATRATKKILDEGVASGDFRQVDHVLFWATLIGMCEFFFLVRPLLKSALRRSSPNSHDLEGFAEYVTEMLLHGIAKSPSKQPSEVVRTGKPHRGKSLAAQASP